MKYFCFLVSITLALVPKIQLYQKYAVPKIQFYPKNGIVKIQKQTNYTVLHRYKLRIPYVVSHISPNITAEMVESSCIAENTTDIQTEVNKYLAVLMSNYIIDKNVIDTQTENAQVIWHFPGDSQNLIRNLECSVIHKSPLCSETTDEEHCNNNLNCCFSKQENKCYGHIFEYEPFFDYISKLPKKVKVSSIVYIPPNSEEILVEKSRKITKNNR